LSSKKKDVGFQITGEEAISLWMFRNSTMLFISTVLPDPEHHIAKVFVALEVLSKI
jgi:hypothetical protein